MQIYRCMINRYIDKHGSIREYIGNIHQKKMSTPENEDNFFNVDELMGETNGGLDITLPKNPKPYQYYKLVYDLKIDTIEGLDYHSSLSGHTTYYYPTNFRLEEYNE